MCVRARVCVCECLCISVLLQVSYYQPPVVGQSDQSDFNVRDRDHAPYPDRYPEPQGRGGLPAINYGNELSRERLPYSQVRAVNCAYCVCVCERV